MHRRLCWLLGRWQFNMEYTTAHHYHIERCSHCKRAYRTVKVGRAHPADRAD